MSVNTSVSCSVTGLCLRFLCSRTDERVEATVTQRGIRTRTQWDVKQFKNYDYRLSGENSASALLVIYTEIL